eukprot:GGOE01009846.1.p2 GENE.GGOE01009846.1~~GGOE01009846.1.p2  ORF type:complete len:201 (+),score=34.66 GGOE01009846.1:26-604(+)
MMTRSCRSFLSRRCLQPISQDTTEWAKQAATLNALQAVTTEVSAETVPDAHRGVRWLREVLRSSTEDMQPPLPAQRQSSCQLDAEWSGAVARVRRRGLVVGGEGQWQSAANTKVARAFSGVSMLPSTDGTAAVHATPLPRSPRRGSFRPATPGRVSSWIECESDDSADEADFEEGRLPLPLPLPVVISSRRE